MPLGTESGGGSQNTESDGGPPQGSGSGGGSPQNTWAMTCSDILDRLLVVLMYAFIYYLSIKRYDVFSTGLIIVNYFWILFSLGVSYSSCAIKQCCWFLFTAFCGTLYFAKYEVLESRYNETEILTVKECQDWEWLGGQCLQLNNTVSEFQKARPEKWNCEVIFISIPGILSALLLCCISKCMSGSSKAMKKRTGCMKTLETKIKEKHSQGEKSRTDHLKKRKEIMSSMKTSDEEILKYCRMNHPLSLAELNKITQEGEAPDPSPTQTSSSGTCADAGSSEEERCVDALQSVVGGVKDLMHSIMLISGIKDLVLCLNTKVLRKGQDLVQWLRTKALRKGRDLVLVLLRFLLLPTKVLYCVDKCCSPQDPSSSSSQDCRSIKRIFKVIHIVLIGPLILVPIVFTLLLGISVVVVLVIVVVELSIVVIALALGSVYLLIIGSWMYLTVNVEECCCWSEDKSNSDVKRLCCRLSERSGIFHLITKTLEEEECCCGSGCCGSGCCGSGCCQSGCCPEHKVPKETKNDDQSDEHQPLLPGENSSDPRYSKESEIKRKEEAHVQGGTSRSPETGGGGESSDLKLSSQGRGADSEHQINLDDLQKAIKKEITDMKGYSLLTEILGHWLASVWHIVCYVLMILYSGVEGSLLSLFYPIMVFFWAMPVGHSLRFWIVAMILTMVLTSCFPDTIKH